MNKKKKIVAIIQARTTSVRFPEKIFHKVGKLSLLEFILHRVKSAKMVDKTIVAIPNNQKNFTIKAKLKNKVDVFSGSENDVLDRFYSAANKYRADVIVRICGDCPFVDPNIIDKLISILKEKKYDYVSNTINPTFPDGLDVEVFSYNTLKKTWLKTKTKHEREHVTPYMINNSKFNKYNYKYKKNLSKVRLTVDEKSDLDKINFIFNFLKKKRNLE